MILLIYVVLGSLGSSRPFAPMQAEFMHVLPPPAPLQLQRHGMRRLKTRGWGLFLRSALPQRAVFGISKHPKPLAA